VEEEEEEDEVLVATSTLVVVVEEVEEEEEEEEVHSIGKKWPKMNQKLLKLQKQKQYLAVSTRDSRLEECIIGKEEKRKEAGRVLCFFVFCAWLYF